MEDYMFNANELEECSSGCESGWTLYLDQSSISPMNSSYDRAFSKAKKSRQELDEHEEEEDEDEDLSMVSDASSGPPHVHEEEGNDRHALGPYGFNRYVTSDDALSKNRKKNREIVNRRRFCSNNNNNNNNNNKVVQDRDSLLDDTASSPLFDFSDKSSTLTRSKASMENVLEYSQGYSTTQFEQVRPPYQHHYDEFNHLHQQNQW